MGIFWAQQDARYGKTPSGIKDIIPIGHELQQDLLAAISMAERTGMIVGKVECPSKAVEWVGGSVYKTRRPLSARFTTLEQIEKEYLS